MSAWVMVLVLLSSLPQSGAVDCTEQGLYLDPASQTWQLVGLVENAVHYALPGVDVDLAQISFPAGDGGRHSVWVTAGLQFRVNSDPTYIPLGPWSTPAEWESISADHPLVHVVVAPTHPSSKVQQFAQSDLVISDSFIASGGNAPSWYPWGFVFGTLAPLSCEVSHEAPQQPIHSIHFVEE